MLWGALLGFLFHRCELKNINCGEGQCENDFYSFECQCNPGSRHKNDRSTLPCIIDYCPPNLCGNGDCSMDEFETSYECQCDQGYENDTTMGCIDIDECETDNICGNVEAGTCFNQDGKFACSCKDGFINKNGPNSECIDIDECYDFDCGFNNTCTNTDGSYQCECGKGYEHKNTWDPCGDINECAIQTDSTEQDFCDLGTCSNHPGGYDCTCPEKTFLVFDNGPKKVPFCGKFFLI